MKKIAFFLLMLISVMSYSQIFETKTNIIGKYGINYISGKLDDGTPYIEYGTDFNWQRFYFDYDNKGVLRCIIYQITDDITNLASMLELFKEKNFEVVGDLKYKNPMDNIVCKLTIEDNFYIITMYYQE